MDTLNKFLVAAHGGNVNVLGIGRVLKPDEAMMLAAWLVVMAQMCDPDDKLPSIGDCIEAVENT